MRQRGWSWKETLMAIGIAVVVVVLVLTISGRADQRMVERNDMANLRAVYVALAQYEDLNDQQPAPNLLTVQRDLGSSDYFLASEDPFASTKSHSFPLEPTLPSWGPTSPIRLSFSYVINFVTAGQVKLGPWMEVRRNPRQGVLACGWYGKIQTGRGFEATSDGPIIRVNTDGSVFKLDHRGDTSRFTVEDLFTRR